MPKTPLQGLKPRSAGRAHFTLKQKSVLVGLMIDAAQTESVRERSLRGDLSDAPAGWMAGWTPGQSIPAIVDASTSQQASAQDRCHEGRLQAYLHD